MLKNLKIKSKILIALALLCVISLAGLSYIGYQFSAADKTYVAFLDHESTAGLLTARASGGSHKMALEVHRASRLRPDSAGFDALVKSHDKTYVRVVERLDKITALLPERAAKVAELRTAVDALNTLDHKIFDAMKSNDLIEVSKRIVEMDTMLESFLPALTAASDDISKVLEDGKNRVSGEINNTILYGVGAVFIMVVLAVAFAMFVVQAGITSPMHRLRESMLRLANGDSRSEIDGVDRKDEIGQMASAVAVFRTNAIDRERLEREAEDGRALSDAERAEREASKTAEAAKLQQAVEALGTGLGKLAEGDLAYRIDTAFVAHLDGLRRDYNESANKLQATLRSVGTNAKAISAGSNEIRSSADDLSKRTEQQAASVEETAAALEEITTTVKDAASRAQEASDLVARTRSGAENSGRVVRDAIEAMHQIEKSSGEIGNIIGVIDDIAFQTNLLALNAGVEAARAGEAGKGFAVVAQEVRELAQRSANAAKEIKTLIQTSGTQVQAGVRLVGQTGEALDAIVVEVQEINRHVHAIAEATKEQSIGLQEINTAVNTMDQGTQQNAAMVEETTAASHALAQEIGALNAQLAQFRLGSESFAARDAGPRPVSRTAEVAPAPSPARALGNRLASAFHKSGGAAAAVKQEPEWSEF